MNDPVLSYETPMSPVGRARPWIVGSIHLVLIAAMLVGAWSVGISARQYVWVETKKIHFGGDLENAFRHGRHIITQARRAERPKDTKADRRVIPAWGSVFRSYLGFYDWAQSRR